MKKKSQPLISARYTLMAESVIYDNLTNQVSAIGIIEEVTAPTFPTIIHRCSFLTLFEKVKGIGSHLQIGFQLSLGPEILLDYNNIILDFQEKESTRLVIRQNGILIKNEGMLIGKYLQDERPIIEFQIKIKTLHGSKPV